MERRPEKSEESSDRAGGREDREPKLRAPDNGRGAEAGTGGGIAEFGGAGKEEALRKETLLEVQ